MTLLTDVAGEADSYQAPGLTSDIQGFMSVKDIFDGRG